MKTLELCRHLALASVLLACSSSKSNDRNPAPPPPNSGYSSDLNGAWTCLTAVQVEGIRKLIDVGERLIIVGGVVTELRDSNGVRIRWLDTPGTTWYQNIVAKTGFALGFCWAQKGHQNSILWEGCEGWRFSLTGPETLTGYVAFQQVYPQFSARHLQLVTLHRPKK